MIHADVLSTIGHTPLVELSRLERGHAIDQHRRPK
jgi:hypothetical protein